jgi:predicted nucleic acid-binding protein
MIVADANLVASLVVPGESSALAEALQEFDPEWVAPPLLLSELRSVFSKLVRSHRRSASEAHELLELATEAVSDCSLDPRDERVLQLVEESRCSSYDCEYVAVAEELGCRLATFDGAVLKAFPGVAVHPERLLSGPHRS